MIKALIFSLLLVFGSQAVNSETKLQNVTARVAEAADDGYTYEYQWIGVVRWVFVYLDGILIDTYPEE